MLAVALDFVTLQSTIATHPKTLSVQDIRYQVQSACLRHCTLSTESATSCSCPLLFVQGHFGQTAITMQDKLDHHKKIVSPSQQCSNAFIGCRFGTASKSVSSGRPKLIISPKIAQYSNKYYYQPVRKFERSYLHFNIIAARSTIPLSGRLIPLIG